jgi:uncharacterized protein YoxC
MYFQPSVVNSAFAASVSEVKQGARELSTAVSSAVAVASLNINTFVRLKGALKLREEVEVRRATHAAQMKAANE